MLFCISHKYMWSFDDCDTTFRICFCTLITTSLLFCRRRFIWAVGTLLYRSVLLTQINTNIVARSDLYCLFLYFTCPETSFMFGEQEVLIPSMLLCSLYDSLNSSRFVVVRTSNMAASILVQSSVKKSFWVPLSLKISASWSMLHTLGKCRNCDLILFVYLLVCRNS